MKAMDRADGVLASLSLGTCVRNVGSPVSCLLPEPSILFFSWACAHGAPMLQPAGKKQRIRRSLFNSPDAFSIMNICATFCEVAEQCSQPEQNLGKIVLHSKSGSVQGMLGRRQGSSNSRGQDSDPPSFDWPLSLG